MFAGSCPTTFVHPPLHNQNGTSLFSKCQTVFGLQQRLAKKDKNSHDDSLPVWHITKQCMWVEQEHACQRITLDNDTIPKQDRYVDIPV